MKSTQPATIEVLKTAMIALALLLSASVQAANHKLTDLLGHPVVTDGGDKLGNVEDFAINPTTGSIEFVVISIGSFLVQNSLIAVQPDALAPAASGDPLVLKADDLEVAHRFNADNWPSAADVRSAGSQRDASTGETASVAPLSATGKATITAGRKKATWEDGKRELVNGPIRRATPPPQKNRAASAKSRVVPNFKNLDRNRDGRLSRAEIGAELTQRSGFKDLDIDANGAIDDFEYQAYQERIARERRWVGNR